jgi:hypothetical protein
MSNHTSRYCKTLPRVTKAELIGALHQSLLQLRAIGQRVEIDGATYDNTPAITVNTRLMAKAGHIGFTA